MRQTFMRIPVLALLAAFTLAGTLVPTVAAQEAAGPIAAIELAPGVTAEVYAGAPSARADGQTVYLARFVFAPGSEIFPAQPSRHHRPRRGLRLVRLDAGGGGSPRRARGGVRRHQVEGITAPGRKSSWSRGMTIDLEDDVVHMARGPGDEDAVVYGTLVLTSGEPLLMPADMDMSATPTS